MSQKLLIQVFSDIHIELWNKLPEIPVKAKYLFLAGDICTITHPLFYPFFDYCSSHWEKVFYILGNHEFYIKKKNYNELIFEYEHLCFKKYNNVFCLNNSCISLDDNIDVYGTTFWTNPIFNSTYESKMYINDYNWITYFKQGLDRVVDLDINYMSELSYDSLNSLQNHLKQTKKQTIVVTHFPPLRSGTSNPKYLQDNNRLLNSYFTWPDITINNLYLNNVPIWISGHTHWSYDFERDGIRFIGNQLGYKSEITETNLNEDGLYEIEVIS